MNTAGMLQSFAEGAQSAWKAVSFATGSEMLSKVVPDYAAKANWHAFCPVDDRFRIILASSCGRLMASVLSLS